MAGTTSPDNLPYPGASDDPDPSNDIFLLAQAVQAALTSKQSGITANTALINQKVLYGPAANVPGSLQPGQLYAGW